MVLAFDLSARMGLAPKEDAVRVREHLKSVGLPVTAPRKGVHGPITVPRLIAHMGQDKKVKDGAITFILARGIGQAFTTAAVSQGDLEAVLHAALNAS